MHGWGKVTRGPSAYVKAFADMGFEPAIAWVWGGLAHRVRRRHRADPRTVHALLGGGRRDRACHHHHDLLEDRLLVAQSRLRIHAAVGPVCFAIALRGGGPYSLDRKIGTEL